MSDVPKVHTAEPLVSLSDDEIAYRANRGKWTLTEALFHLNGYKPPGYESVLHLQDHFWPAYHQAVDAIQMGKIGRKIEQAGETVFIDSPANWLAWADSVGPECITVDERVRRALQGGGAAGNDRAATIRDRTSCQKWLEGLMANGSRPDKNKRDYQSDAKKKFSVGIKAFNLAWANAVVTTGNTAWSRAGPKPRS